MINTIFQKIYRRVKMPYYYLWFYFKGLDYRRISTIGLPIIQNKGGIIRLNGYINMCNDVVHSTLGINRKCKLLVYRNACLEINGSLSMSNTVIVATKKISIGNNVMIGGGVTIVDSDFHSMNFLYWGTHNDELKMKCSDVSIGDNVFIGMNSIVLKGVHIGNGAVVAAGSVVTTNIPPCEIWGGNPAKFIKKR